MSKELIDSIAAEYPTLGEPLRSSQISFEKDPGDGRQLEFYPPWESENPTPGKPHIQVFGDLQGRELEHAVAGDMLHYLGSYHPETGEPPDPKFREMKSEFARTITPDQDATNRRAYAMDQRAHGDVGTYPEWLERSRIDAYIRGYLFPDREDNWRDAYTPDQKIILKRMDDYLREGSDKPKRTTSSMHGVRG